MDFIVQPGGALTGSIRVAPDKSISHRAVMLAALADGRSHIHGFLEGADTLATLAAFAAMGVAVERPAAGEVIIDGVGRDGLRAARSPLDLGNSGTAMRLLCGVLAGQNFDSVLVGDASLSRRPMRRVTEPLSAMGARIEASGNGTAPLTIRAAERLCGIDYPMPVASAQVKSALLLAGLYAQGQTTVHEPAPTRDHTERMLQAFGYPVHCTAGRCALRGGARLTACSLTIPADLSSAAFFLLGASIAEGSDLTLEQVGINPTRTGALDILRLMGADLSLRNGRELGAEPVADVRVRAGALRGVHVPAELVPLAIDEFPALFVAAACAAGETVVTGAAELRVKESDRIQVMADGLNTLGIRAQPTPDGMIVQGGEFRGGTVDAHGDHRIAMAFAMAALRASGPITLRDCANVATSFPDFVPLARQAGLNIEIVP